MAPHRPIATLGLAMVTAACAASAPDDGLSQVTRSALADAARRSGVAADAIRVVSAARVTWRDGSLGCPQPDLMYTQALVPGYRVVLHAAGRRLDYHAGMRGEFQLCPAGQAQDPLPDRDRI